LTTARSRNLPWLLVGAALSLSACCRTVAYVPIREARFRSEITAQDRLSLPLTAADKDRLMAFLRAGGDTDKVGMEVVLPDVPRKYGTLLTRLADEAHLSLTDLTEGTAYNEWFGDLRIRQVIDAREESPSVIDPVAVSDGRFWWIFYVQHRRLTGLLVVKAIPDRPSE
jgi:hypothetical protein